MRFTTQDIVCASKAEASETRRILRACRDERLLDSSSDTHAFVHEIYRRYFLDEALSDRVGIHERLADCLRRIRPGEYELRCANAIAAERPDLAGMLAVQAGLQKEREGGSWKGFADKIRGAIDSSGLADVMDVLSHARRHALCYEFNECFLRLGGLRSDIPRSLLAEAEYLRAMCLMSTRGEDDRAAGRAILDAWLGFEHEEPELGTRLCLLRIFGYSRTPNKDRGRVLELDLKQFLIDRAAFDPSATDALYMLDRSSASLYETDVALVRTDKAVNFHRPATSQDIPRRPIEYYRSLNNYCAELISNAEYESAVTAHGELDSLIASYAPETFPRLDFSAMNGLLANYRTGRVTPLEAARSQEKIIEQLGAASDPFYAENGLAVYLTLDGSYNKSIALFDRIDDDLHRTRETPDPSMVYMIRANRCIARLLAGDTSGRSEEWEELTPVVDSITYMLRRYLVRRHELLRPLLCESVDVAAEEFDLTLVRKHPDEFGKLWNNYGRTLRIAAVGFWREN